MYTRDFKILSSDTDMNRQLRLSALFTYLQEAAIEHTQQLGAGREKTLDRGLLWIVTQQEVHISRLPVYDEHLTLLSWPGETMHMFFPRYWRICDETGQTVIEASSLWGLMEQGTRKLVFPEEYNVSIDASNVDMALLNSLSFPKRIKAQPALETGAFTVPYSYVDLNGHMNNARYFDLACDAIPDQLRGRQLKTIYAEYSGEASLHDTLMLKSLASDDFGEWYFSGETAPFENDPLKRNGQGSEQSACCHPVFRMRLEFFPAK